MPDHHRKLASKWKPPDPEYGGRSWDGDGGWRGSWGGGGGGGEGEGEAGGSSGAVIGMRSGIKKDLEGSTVNSYAVEALGPGPSDISSPIDVSKAKIESEHEFILLPDFNPMDTEKEKYPKWQPVEALGPSPSYITKPCDYNKHRDNLPQTPFVDLMIDNSTKTQTQALDQMEMGEKKYPKQKPGKSECILHLQRAWVVHSAWASIENVCKISSGVLVNKLQCEHIANHFKVIVDVLKKLGLGEDFVSGQALEGDSSIQTNLTFDEERFSHIVKTFEKHMHNLEETDHYDRHLEDFKLGSQIQDMSSMFEDYIRELPDLDGSSEESLSKKPRINENFQDFRLQGFSTKENVEAQSHFQARGPLDEFLCLLLGVLKQGEDLVLFHSGLEVANNGVIERTGLYGEKFIQIHELLYKLLDLYACLEHCEGTEFSQGYLSQHDSCGSQSLLYYLNSNCLEEIISLSIDDNVLSIELATTLSELLKRPNCVLKTLSIKGSSEFKIDQVELQMLQKCRLMVIAALCKCVSITSLTIHGLNGIEVYELCKSLSINKVLENLVIWIDEPHADDNAMDISTMLMKNHSLKSFTLKSKEISPNGAAYFGAMLAKNSSLEKLNLQCQSWDKIGMKDLMRPLMADKDGKPQVNLSLKHLHIDISYGCPPRAAEITAQLFLSNKTLTHFSINSLDLDSNAACEILDSLKKNRTLQVLDLQGQSSFYSNDYKVVAHLEAMLAKNSTLEELKVDMHMWDKFSLKHLLRPLMANEDGKPHVNSSLKQLHILNFNCNQDQGAVQSIAEVLRTNKTLSHFSMINASLSTYDVCEILDSLKFNKALQILSFDECTGLDDPLVNVEFMELLVNNNFTLSTIRMLGRDWDIEAFMKSELEDDATMAKERLWSNFSPVGNIYDFPIVHMKHDAYDLKQAQEDLSPKKGEGSTIEKHGSFEKVFKEHQEELLVGCSSNPKEIFGLKCKLEMESEQLLQGLKPSLELVSKSTDFLLQRNLNMAELLRKRYIEWNSFAGMFPSKLTDEEKKEFSKGCIIAALFPTTFLYHLKVHLLEVGLNVGGILHTLKEVAGLVVQRMKSLQDSGSQTFQFIDYVQALLDVRAPLDVQHIYSSVETIAICQTFSTRTGIGEELPEENSIQYSIVQDHLTSAYYVESDKSSNLDKPNIDKSAGVIAVKVTCTKIQVEIMWKDGSYYLGPLEDFSYDLELDDNKQCALEAFGDLKGAHFLKTRGLKCSPLLIIALAMAIHKRGLALTWKNGKGHIQSNSLLPSKQPMELEVWEGQILFDSDINQLGETVEWGMNQFDQNCVASSRVHTNKQLQVVSKDDVDQNMHISHISNYTSKDIEISHQYNDTSSHTRSNVDLSAMAAQFSAGAQNKQKYSIGVKVLGSGGDIGFEKQNSKGKKVENQSFQKIQELYWEEKGGYIIGKLKDRHELLEEKLYQGSLYAERDLNYLVVYDGCTASHVSIYWVKEWIDDPRLELEWVTDIFIKEGPEEIKSIFKGLKGETLEVTRTGTEFLENSSRQQSKGLVKRFLNHYSNKGSCKGNVLQMVSKFEDHAHLIFEGRSNDEWEHIVGLQPNICSNKCWWKASYMQAITYSRTRYSSGLLLSTHTTQKHGLKWGSCRRLDGSNYIHKSNVVKSCGKFSKPPQSLSSKWHDMIHWGGLRESLV